MNRLLIAVLGVFASIPGTLVASPVVEGIYPCVGQLGVEFTVSLSGGQLTDPLSILFYDSGITCTKLTSVSETEVQATIQTTKNCRLGEHAFRLVSKAGLSEIRTLSITSLPVILEGDPDNNSANNSQPVPLNSTVVGRVDSGDVDCYSVSLKKGQRLSAEIEAIRLGSPLDAVLTIYDPSGKELIEVDDSPLFRQDPLASIVATQDGKYVIAVRDTAFGGGDAETYALHVGTFIRPLAVYPAGGPIGIETTVKLLGNPTGERSQILKPVDTSFVFYPTDGEINSPTPNAFRVSSFPNVLEVEPNDSPQLESVAPSWPIAFNGILEKSGDVDHFCFRARAGELLDVSAFAFRIGSPVDTMLAILDEKGQLLASNDDDETHDSRIRFTCPKDGVYFVRVQDKRKKGGPLFIYRVEITKPLPGLTLFLASPGRKSQDRNTVVVPRGNRVSAFLAVRRDAVIGPVGIQPKDLPEGISIAGPIIVPADEYLIPVIVDASATAKLGGKLLTMQGQAKDIHGGFSQTANLVRAPGDLSLHSITVDKLALVVVDEAPFSIDLETPKTDLTIDGSLDLTVYLNRSTGFEDAVDVSFPFLPPGVEAPASIVIPAGKSQAVVTLNSKRNAVPGNWPIFAEAKVASAFASRRDASTMTAPPKANRRVRKAAANAPPVSSQRIMLRVAAANATATIAPAIAEQGKTAKVQLIFTDGVPPTGFIAHLAGLPPRATSQPIPIVADTKELQFIINVDATTPLGEHTSLICEITGEINGQHVVYRVGRPGILTVFPSDGILTDKDGKPLSRLDALRLKQAENKAP